MKRLTIDWHALETAFEDLPDELGIDRTNYLDQESGEIIFVDEEISSTVDSIIEELEECSGEDTDWTDDKIRETDGFQRLSKEEQSSVLAVIKMNYGDSSRFAEIPSFDSGESYNWMRDFIESVDDNGLQGRLSEAISQRRPFRRFRDVLAGDRRLERQWHEFESTRQREAIIEWLHSIGVEPTNPENATYNPPPLPDLRNIMFAEVRRFVRFARDIEGIRRIALIGSLTTDKEFPKDIDMLVTVSDDCNLAPLAELARQLSGHMNSHRAGSDVFIASEEGVYLGRTCPWRDCGPSFRASCDAVHCGLRPYLHDDFDAIRLKKDVIAHPPVLLWPEIATKQEVASDVQEQLIKQLAEDEVR